MFEKVMLAMDMSERTGSLLPAFYSLCPDTDTEIFLLHVVENRDDQDHNSSYYKKTQSRLVGFVHDLQKAGYDKVHIAWTYNDEPMDGILTASQEQKADLVIMVSHGKGKLERALRGSTTFDVARASEIPVLIVKEEAPREDYLARVLLPTDFSRASLAGLNLVRNLREHVGEIIFLHVVERWRSEKEYRSKLEAARNLLQEMVDEMKTFGISARYVIEDGAASKEVCHLAEREKCTLVCVAKTGMGLVKRLIIGSTASNIVMDTDCSVLLLPGREEE